MMNENIKKPTYVNRTKKRVALIIVLIMAVLSMIICYNVGDLGITVEGASIIAISITGLLMTAVLYTLMMSDHRELSLSDSLFLITLLLFANCLFFTELSWLAEGHTEAIWMIYATEALVVMCSTSMVIIFYQYLLSTILAEKKDKLKPLTIALIVYVAISFIIALSNPFTGLIFTLDEIGNEVSGPLIFLIDAEALYPFWLLAFVWVFISIYDGSRRKLESKKHDIAVADSVFRGIVPQEDEDIVLTPEMQALIDKHTIPDAMKLTEMLTRERVRSMTSENKKNGGPYEQ